MANLAQEIGTGVSPRARPTFGYYRQPNGWITASPATDLEELRYRKQGWTPLPAYRRFDMASQYAADHPFDALFLLGGAHELSVEQVIANGFNLNPPLAATCRTPLHQYHPNHTADCWRGAQPVEFPQLAGLTVERFTCRFCEAVRPTEAGCEQHENVAHKKERGDVRTGEVMAASLAAGLAPALAGGNQRGAMPDVDQLAAAALQRLLKKVKLTPKQKAALSA